MGMFVDEFVEDNFINDINDSSDSSSGQIQNRQRTSEIVFDNSKFLNESSDDVKKALNEI